jgi:hypothetical protein
MQDFHPDCTINILVSGQGRPAKLVWCCSLVLRSGQRLVTVKKFTGIAPREQVEWQATLFGLEQATRLQQEKVMLASDLTLPGIHQTPASRLRDPALQLMREDAENLWAGFRLRKTGRLDEKEAAHLREAAADGFRRPRERS